MNEKIFTEATAKFITELSKKAHAIAKEKGFHEAGIQPMGQYLMLITSELGEAMEADRRGKYAWVPDLQRLKNAEQFDAVEFKDAIKDTVEDELADALIRILDLAGLLDIDIGAHVMLKMEYNKTRPIRHGKKY